MTAASIEQPRGGDTPDGADSGLPTAQSHSARGLPALAMGAVGVVYGDIGTSPLYALKEAFVGHHPLSVDRLHIFGVLSLVFWTLVLIVTIKYVLLILRADNKGEGGSLALLALIQRMSGTAGDGARVSSCSASPRRRCSSATR